MTIVQQLGMGLPLRQATISNDWILCGSSDVYCPGRTAEHVLGDRSDVTAAMLLYLFRRFGYPRYGWDPDKRVVDYYLTTPDPEIVLVCTPAFHTRVAFGFGLTSTLDQAAVHAMYTERQSHGHESWQRHPLYRRIDVALRTSIRELLRPVRVGDAAYTIIGRFDHEPLAAMYEPAVYSHHAGYGLGDYDPSQ